MEEKDYISMTVKIGGRAYPLKIDGADEPLISKIVDDVNSKIDSFRTIYSRKDAQDHLAMAILTYAVDFHKTQPTQNQPELSERLSSIDAMLDKALMMGE
jgi:hypothetical protein